MPYPANAFLSILIFAFVHLYADRFNKFERWSKGRVLSASGGIAIAYVFVGLLPKLCKNASLIQQTLAETFPYFEKHAFVMALIGFLLYFTVNSSSKFLHEKGILWFSLGSYALFNFLVGYSVVDKDDPDVQPLVLFTIAIALHYFIHDYHLSMKDSIEYQRKGRWILIASLVLGWVMGIIYVLPKSAIAMVSAFIGGGVIFNVTRHQLPKETSESLSAFLIASVVYAAILLAIGS